LVLINPEDLFGGGTGGTGEDDDGEAISKSYEGTGLRGDAGSGLLALFPGSLSADPDRECVPLLPLKGVPGDEETAAAAPADGSEGFLSLRRNKAGVTFFTTGLCSGDSPLGEEDWAGLEGREEEADGGGHMDLPDEITSGCTIEEDLGGEVLGLAGVELAGDPVPPPPRNLRTPFMY
jgi:hypothetical protein